MGDTEHRPLLLLLEGMVLSWPQGQEECSV